MSAGQKELAIALRKALLRYRGGRFVTGDNGGASGMIFFEDCAGSSGTSAGWEGDHVAGIVTALNATLRLLEQPPEPKSPSALRSPLSLRVCGIALPQQRRLKPVCFARVL